MHSRSILLSLALVLAAAACGGAPRAVAPPRSDADLVAGLAARRADALDRLRAYRQAETYPTDADGLPLAVFRDAHGVRCPMSELIFQSGRGDLVDAVVATNNALRLADVHDGPLLAWMQESGLTRDEIIEIQGVMEYGFELQVDDKTGEQRMVQVARMPAWMANAAALPASPSEQISTKLDAVTAKLARQTPRSLAAAAAQLRARRHPAARVAATR